MNGLGAGIVVTDYLNRMLADRGPIVPAHPDAIGQINFGDAPVHYNPGLPHGNKGIDWETGILLCNFVEAYKPRQIVELGTFRGYSTAWLVLGTLLAGSGRVDAFDVFPEGYYGSMWYDEYQLPKTNFKYHEVPGGIWKHAERVPDTIDLLYHDTEHLPGPTQKEMAMLLPRVPIGGIVLIDDMLHPDYKPMQNILHNLFAFPNADHIESFEQFSIRKADWPWSWSVLPIGHGLGVANRIK